MTNVNDDVSQKRTFNKTIRQERFCMVRIRICAKMLRFSISNSFQVAIKLRIANTPKRD